MSGFLLQKDSISRSTPRIVRAGWRAWVAILTGLAFVLLLATAATHHHESSLQDRDCAVCTAVAGKVSGTAMVAPSAQTILLLQYTIFSAAIRYVASIPALFFPPICGPPSL